MSKQKKKPQLRQSEIGRYWTLQAVSRKHGVPPTNIVRASKGVPGKPKIHSLRMCDGTGVEVYYEPDVKAYAKVYEPIKFYQLDAELGMYRILNKHFFKTIDEAFDKLKMDKSKLDMVKFESKLENLANNDNDTRLLDNEQNFIRKKIGEVQSEINQLENNLLFFSNVDESNPLVKDVLKNINKHKKDLETWKAKLAKIRGMYS